MSYENRGKLIRNALTPEHHGRIRDIFEGHISGRSLIIPCGEGHNRKAFSVGACDVLGLHKVPLLLKLLKDDSLWTLEDVMDHPSQCAVAELGAFAFYHDFIAGAKDEISFLSPESHRRFSRESSLCVPERFRLDQCWGGTRVQQGDLGAIPYFHLAVSCVIEGTTYFGILTEGTPPAIAPRGTAVMDHGDEGTVECGRIIDLGACQSLLIKADRGALGSGYADNLGVRQQGLLFFREEHMLHIASEIPLRKAA